MTTSAGTMIIRPVSRSDGDSWLELRRALWPEEQEGEHLEAIERFFGGAAREPVAVLIAEQGRGGAIAFAELSIRAYAEGCSTDRVAYIEGWYVTPEARRRGVGRALLAAAEDWGRAMGCSEIGSDTELHDYVSAAAHLSAGFAEVGQIRCYRKDL